MSERYQPGTTATPDRPGSSLDQEFNDIIDSQDWGDFNTGERIDQKDILNTPTPLDALLPYTSQSNPEQYTEEQSAQFNALDSKIREITGDPDMPGNELRPHEDPRWSTYGVMHDFLEAIPDDGNRVASEENGSGDNARLEPGAAAALRIVSRFPHPEALLEQYNEKRDSKERHARMTGGFIPESEEYNTLRMASVDQMLSTLYGERYDAFKQSQSNLDSEKGATDDPVVEQRDSNQERNPEATQESFDNDEAERSNISPEVHEILSGFQMLRGDVRQGANSVIYAVQKTLAHSRNVAGMPNRLRHYRAKNRAEKRLNTAEDKFETAKQRYEEASELQDMSNSRIVNMWRDRKAARRYNTMKKREAKRNERLSSFQSKESAYNLHVDTARGRLTSVDKKSVERAEAIEKRREKLMEKRINAETRKLARVEERNNRRRERGEMDEQQKNLPYEDRMSHTERQNKIREKSRLSPEEIQVLRVKATRNLQARGALV